MFCISECKNSAAVMSWYIITGNWNRKVEIMNFMFVCNQTSLHPLMTPGWYFDPMICSYIQNKAVFTMYWSVFVRLFSVSPDASKNSLYTLHLSWLHGGTLSTCASPLCHVAVFFCLSVLMSRWNSWSCSNVSRPVWFGGCIESATESPHG